MDPEKKRLMGSIINFLKGELSSRYLNSEHLEGLEVAIQCLESIYEVGEPDENEPDLIEIFSTYQKASILCLPDASDDDKKEAERLKNEGNSAMNAQLFNDALDCYTKAIQLDPKNAVFYCNRAAAFSKMHDHRSAIRDCKVAIEIDPKYSKAYGRLGLAYTGLDDFEKALENYHIAADLDPENEGYKNNVTLAERKLTELYTTQLSGRSNAAVPSGESSGAPNLNMMFSNPHLIDIASQMLANPSMQNMMSTIMSGNLSQDAGMGALLQAGQQLAQQLQNENPELVDQLRQTLGSGDARVQDSVEESSPSPHPPNTENPEDKQ